MRFDLIVEQLMLDDIHDPFCFYKTDSIILFAILFYVVLGQLKGFPLLNCKALS